MTYDLAREIDMAYESQDADQPKFAVGEAVYIRNRQETITGVQNIGGEWYYQIERWSVGRWGESLITSADDWQARQAVIAAETEARAQADADRYEDLLADDPMLKSRSLFESDEDFEWTYIVWAESFWGCGNLPSDVRWWYNQFLLKNGWTVQS